MFSEPATGRLICRAGDARVSSCASATEATGALFDKTANSLRLDMGWEKQTEKFAPTPTLQLLQGFMLWVVMKASKEN